MKRRNFIKTVIGLCAIPFAGAAKSKEPETGGFTLGSPDGKTLREIDGSILFDGVDDYLKPFTPADIDGLTRWIDTNDNLSKMTDSEGNHIGWIDKSGNENHLYFPTTE